MARHLLADGFIVDDADSGLLADGVVLVAAASGVPAQLVTGANSQQVNTASSGGVTQSSGGTIQLPHLSEWETGNLLTSQAGITVWINDEESGALMVKLTGISTAAVTAAFSPISHASLTPGTAYSVRTRLANGAQYTWTYLAS